jgi:hypothetical protein
MSVLTAEHCFGMLTDLCMEVQYKNLGIVQFVLQEM